MIERSVEAVLFDFDGTIVNSLPGWIAVIETHLKNVEHTSAMTQALPQNAREIMSTLATELMSIQNYGMGNIYGYTP